MFLGLISRGACFLWLIHCWMKSKNSFVWTLLRCVYNQSCLWCLVISTIFLKHLLTSLQWMLVCPSCISFYLVICWSLGCFMWCKLISLFSWMVLILGIHSSLSPRASGQFIHYFLFLNINNFEFAMNRLGFLWGLEEHALRLWGHWLIVYWQRLFIMFEEIFLCLRYANFYFFCYISFVRVSISLGLR